VSINLSRKPLKEEVEEICCAAEEAARKYLLSKIPMKRMRDMDIVVEALGDKPLTLNIEISTPPPSREGYDAEKLVDEATEIAFKAAEEKMKELKLCENSKS
jgi:hypothetical protein